VVSRAKLHLTGSIGAVEARAKNKNPLEHKVPHVATGGTSASASRSGEVDDDSEAGAVRGTPRGRGRCGFVAGKKQFSDPTKLKRRQQVHKKHVIFEWFFFSGGFLMLCFARSVLGMPARRMFFPIELQV
jgi:hypothetical protein